MGQLCTGIARFECEPSGELASEVTSVSRRVGTEAEDGGGVHGERKKTALHG